VDHLHTRGAASEKRLARCGSDPFSQDVAKLELCRGLVFLFASGGAIDELCDSNFSPGAEGGVVLTGDH